MRLTKTVLPILISITLAWSGAESHAGSPQEFMSEGNELFREGRLDDALKCYERVLADRPDMAEIHFNLGNVRYGKGDFSGARESYMKAALLSGDATLLAKLHYNLGNAAVQEAEKSSRDAPEKSLAQYEQAIRHYRDALRMNTGLEEAARNWEIARLRMRALEEILEKREKAAASEDTSPVAAGKDRSSEEARGAERAGDKKTAGQTGSEKAKDSAEESTQRSDGSQTSPPSDSGERLGKDSEEPQGETASDIVREEKNRRTAYRSFHIGYKPVEKDW